MAKGYWIAQVDVDDVEQYKLYVAAIAEPLRKYGARLLVRNTARYQVVEGSSRQRHAVIEFPSYQAALDCRNSPEYQAAMKLRAGVSRADAVVIEGYDETQASVTNS